MPWKLYSYHENVIVLVTDLNQVENSRTSTKQKSIQYSPFHTTVLCKKNKINCFIDKDTHTSQLLTI